MCTGRIKHSKRHIQLWLCLCVYSRRHLTEKGKQQLSGYRMGRGPRTEEGTVGDECPHSALCFLTTYAMWPAVLCSCCPAFPTTMDCEPLNCKTEEGKQYTTGVLEACLSTFFKHSWITCLFQVSAGARSCYCQ